MWRAAYTAAAAHRRGGRLKAGPGEADAADMASRDAACPVCDADLPLGGDEKLGEQVHCAYCGAPALVRARPDEDEGDWELEEDF